MTDRWTIYVCPACGTIYADLSNVCECRLPEGVIPEPVEVVRADVLREATDELDLLGPGVTKDSRPWLAGLADRLREAAA